MKAHAVLICLLAPAFGVACEPPVIPKESLVLVKLNPEVEAENAVRTGKIQFLAVQGYATETPGAPGIAYCWLDAHLARILDDTTDFVCGQAQRDFKQAAYSFSKRFNAQLFKLSAQLQKHTCAT